jgi:membrane protein implicated in regulation of membrane protease activity
MARTIEFVWYLFLVGVLIAALHLADVRPWTERFALILWPILIGESVWFFASYLPRRSEATSEAQSVSARS